MNKSSYVIISVFLVLSCGFLFGAEGSAGGYAVDVLQEEMIGIALFPDGSTPVPDLPVRVWDSARKRVIHRTVTDANGVFHIPRINTGECFVFVGRVKINLRILNPVADGFQQPNDIIVVVPRGKFVTASPHVVDVLIAPLIMRPPPEPKVVSP